jgi:flagellar biosynthesis protein FlhG
MSGFAFDQAEGLRRLLGRDQMRVIAVVSGKPRVGQTNVVINLAHALATQGKSVLILDEGIGADSSAARLGLAPRVELAQVLKARIPLPQALLSYSAALHVLPAREGLRRVAQLSAEEQDRLTRELATLALKPDFLLLDLAADRSHITHAATAAADEVLVVVSPEHDAITQSYALIKQLAQEYGRRHFRLLASKTKNDEDTAAVYNNMLSAAARYLNAQLSELSTVPWDDAVRRANRLGKPAVEIFPDAPASQAYRSLAQTIAAWPMMREDGGHLDGFLHRLIISSRMMELSVRI